jgi:dipeptidyl aminopeptidase/acylaminoacyl peptidase
MMRKSIVFLALLFFVSHAVAQVVTKRLIKPEDIYRMKSVGSTKISPDGHWILYSLSMADSSKDRNENKLYMLSAVGDETIQLTDERSAGAPAWSPDNKYISFLSKGKAENSPSQIFLMNRKGGEPIQLTELKGEISGYKWFYDASKILITMRDPSTADTAKTKIRKPYEINRYHFKDDTEGYLDNRKTHLYLYDLKQKTYVLGDKNQANATIGVMGKRSYVAASGPKKANSDIF